MQAVQKGLADLAGPGGAEAAADCLRLVDTYIKVPISKNAIFLSISVELTHWDKIIIFKPSRGVGVLTDLWVRIVRSGFSVQST